MELTPDKKKLMSLVEMAISGDLALPEFQRNFVWSIPDISDLLLSIFKGYFDSARTSPRSCPIPSAESRRRRYLRHLWCAAGSWITGRAPS